MSNLIGDATQLTNLFGWAGILKPQNILLLVCSDVFTNHDKDMIKGKKKHIP